MTQSSSVSMRKTHDAMVKLLSMNQDLFRIAAMRITLTVAGRLKPRTVTTSVLNFMRISIWNGTRPAVLTVSILDV